MATTDPLYIVLPLEREVPEGEIRRILAALERARQAYNADTPAYRHARPLGACALQLAYGSEGDAEDAIVKIQGLPRAFADAEDWRTGRISVLDGGRDYFRAEYDLRAGRVRTFIVHGES